MCFHKTPNNLNSRLFWICCHPLEEITGAEGLHIRCCFCFALIMGNQFVCIIDYVLLWKKIRLHLEVKRRGNCGRFQHLQQILNHEETIQKSQAIITLILACFISWKQQSCLRSAAFPGYCGHNYITVWRQVLQILNSAWHSIQSQHNVIYLYEEPSRSTWLWIFQLWGT